MPTGGKRTSPSFDTQHGSYLAGCPWVVTTGARKTQTCRAPGKKTAGETRAHVGFQARPAPVFRALDIVVHASTQPEPFGRTIAEGMACARPVIVSAAGGAVELFTPDHDAIGIPPGDPAALAAAIARLAADPSLRQRLGEHGRQTAVERFNRDRLGPQLMAIYQRILERRGP